MAPRAPNTGSYEYYESQPSGGAWQSQGSVLNGTYSFASPGGQVSFSGTNGSRYSSDTYAGHDNTSDPFSVTLQLATEDYVPQLASSSQFSIGAQLVNGVNDLTTWIQDTATAFANELYLAVADPGGTWTYYEVLIVDAIETYQSYVNGQIDGFLDVINPFEGMQVWGYDLSIPNLGPVAGHEFAYTVGYVQGAVAGVVVQIGVGVLSGGASAPACASAIAKVGLAAARVYTFVDTAAAVGQGIQQANHLATNGGNMTGWQIAGNVGMIGLNFAPALGAAGGAALKKLNGPDFLKLGGCFVAGTAVHLSASPVAVSELELAYAATASESFSFDLGFAWEEPRAESALVVPIEQVPLGSRIATKNPEAFGAENPIPDAHESTWRLLSAEIEREDGARVEVELLRPVAWIEEQAFTPGARIYLRLEELNVAGWATIRAVDPCPTLSNGHGNLVTGRFVTRGATNLVEATFSDGTVLNGTSIHPVWSLDRMDWIPLGELAIGEHVYSNDGPLHLVEHTAHSQPTDVYNIEVDCEHVYQVGDAGILVHNTCAGDHHMVPRSLGSTTPYRHSSLTPLSATEHTALHAALTTHLRGVKKTIGGKTVDMMPRAFNSGSVVRLNFTRTERLRELAKFYKTYDGGKYMGDFLTELRIAIQNGWVA